LGPTQARMVIGPPSNPNKEGKKKGGGGTTLLG